MSFLRKLFGSGGSSGDDGMYFYVRCSACNEPIRIRANPSTDLSPVYDESSPGDDPTGYELHKEILGTRCYRLIRAEGRSTGARTSEPRYRAAGDRSRERSGAAWLTTATGDRMDGAALTGLICRQCS
ncbi:MAG: hypothetical protein WKH64_19405 [Chloroflexia bacterium]